MTTSDLDSELESTFLAQRRTPCLGRLDAQRSWARTLALRVGSRHIGVRVNSDTAARAVEELFRSARRPELDVLAPANFSVEIAPPTRGATRGAARRGLHLVYRDHVIVARRRDPDELLQDLVSLLEATGYRLEQQHLAVNASALVGPDGEVTLLPPQWHRLLVLQQRRLAGSGLRLLPADAHLLDPETGRLVGRPVGPATARQASAALPVARWGARIAGEEDRALRAAQGIQLVFPSVANVPAVGPSRALRALLRVSSTATFVGLRAQGDSGAVTAAIGLALTDRRVGAGGNTPT